MRCLSFFNYFFLFHQRTCHKASWERRNEFFGAKRGAVHPGKLSETQGWADVPGYLNHPLILVFTDTPYLSISVEYKHLFLSFLPFCRIPGCSGLILASASIATPCQGLMIFPSRCFPVWLLTSLQPLTLTRARRCGLRGGSGAGVRDKVITPPCSM